MYRLVSRAPAIRIYATNLLKPSGPPRVYTAGTVADSDLRTGPLKSNPLSKQEEKAKRPAILAGFLFVRQPLTARIVPTAHPSSTPDSWCAEGRFGCNQNCDSGRRSSAIVSHSMASADILSCDPANVHEQLHSRPRFSDSSVFLQLSTRGYNARRGKIRRFGDDRSPRSEL